MGLTIATIDEAGEYFAARLSADAWNDATDDDKTKALAWATAIFEAVVSFDYRSFLVADDGTKTFVGPIKNALFEQAIYLLKIDPTEYPELLTLGVASANGAAFDRSFVAPLLAPASLRLLRLYASVTIAGDNSGSASSSSLGY